MRGILSDAKTHTVGSQSRVLLLTLLLCLFLYFSITDFRLTTDTLVAGATDTDINVAAAFVAHAAAVANAHTAAFVVAAHTIAAAHTAAAAHAAAAAVIVKISARLIE